MDEVKNTAGASAADAGEKPVEKTESEKIAEVLEASALRIKELEVENAKAIEEKENYRKGMLSAKGKLKELKDQGYDVGDEKPELNEDSIVAKVVEQLKPLVAPKQDDLKTKVSELATALRNRSQVNNSASGTSTEGQEVKKEFFTPEQLEDLKSRGLDPKKVEENIRKQKEKT